MGRLFSEVLKKIRCVMFRLKERWWKTEKLRKKDENKALDNEKQKGRLRQGTKRKGKKKN